MRGFAVMTLACGAILVAGIAAAQVAPKALDSFKEICLPGASHIDTVAAFERTGWTEAPDELSQFFNQDVVDPDAEERFILNYQGGVILAAALSERRGLLAKRDMTVCMVRVFTDDPTRMRADFLSRMDVSPDQDVDSEEVRANIWFEILGLELVAFRAVKIQENMWSVTTYRTLING